MCRLVPERAPGPKAAVDEGARVLGAFPASPRGPDLALVEAARDVVRGTCERVNVGLGTAVGESEGERREDADGIRALLVLPAEVLHDDLVQGRGAADRGQSLLHVRQRATPSRAGRQGR